MGPLPRLHRLVLVLVTVLSGVVGGLWLAHFDKVPVVMSAGALLGGLGGLMVAAMMAHDAALRPGAEPLHTARRPGL